MDPTKSESQRIIDQLSTTISSLDINTLTLPGFEQQNLTMGSIDLSDTDTVSITGPSASIFGSGTTIAGGAVGGTFSVGTPTGGNGTITGGPYIFTTNNTGGTPGTLSQGGRMTLMGEKADIEINGISLMETLKSIQERLNLLRPNPELEAEWDELRELGEQYRDLEKKCKEKIEIWKKLKQMPPPEL